MFKSSQQHQVCSGSSVESERGSPKAEAAGLNPARNTRYAAVAQRTEPGASTSGVAGSNPAGGSSFKMRVVHMTQQRSSLLLVPSDSALSLYRGAG